MKFSSLIKNTNSKDFVKLLSTEKKQLIFLISVGQPYHEDDDLYASIQVIYDLIYASASVHLDDNTTEYAKNLQSPWTITIIAADTLQAYNHATDAASLKEQHDIWDKRGSAWLKKYIPFFDKLKSAGQGRIAVEVQYKKWSRLLESAKEFFHFSEYYDELCKQYANEESYIFKWANHKSHRHAFRLENPERTTQPGDGLQEQWKLKPIQIPNRLQYILEELAVLNGCIPEGLLIPERERINTSNTGTWLTYPSNEEVIFRHARTAMREFAKEKNFLHQFVFQWLNIHLRDVVDPEYSFTSNSNLRHYTREDLIAHRLSLGKFIEKVYFCRSEDFVCKYSANFPTFSTQNYFENRLAYRELVAAVDAKIMVIYGDEHTGKSSLAREYIYNHSDKFSQLIWLERDNTQNPYMNAISVVARQYKLADFASTDFEIKNAFCAFINANSPKLILFKNAKHFSEIADYIPTSAGQVFVTTAIADPEAWTTHMNQTVRRIEIKPFSIENKEAEQCFVKLTGCVNDPVMLAKICQHSENKPNKVYFHALLYNMYKKFQRTGPSHSLEQFYQMILATNLEESQKPKPKPSQTIWRDGIRITDIEAETWGEISQGLNVFLIADKIKNGLFNAALNELATILANPATINIKLNALLQKAILFFATGESARSLELFNLILTEEHLGIMTSPEFWADIYYRCYVIYKQSLNRVAAKNAIEKAISYTTDKNSRAFYLYQVALNIVTTTEKTTLFYNTLQILETYHGLFHEDFTFALMLAEIGHYFLEQDPVYAEPFLLASLDLQNAYYGSQENFNLFSTLNLLSVLYYKLENYALSQLYAKKALTCAVGKNDWKQHPNAACDALLNYFYACQKLNDIEPMQYAYAAILHCVNLDNLSNPSKYHDFIHSVRHEPALQNLNLVDMSMEHFTTEPGIAVFIENCHYANAKLFKLAKEQQVTIHHKSRFFSASNYASHEQPDGPYSDYYCAPGDELTELSALLSHF